MAQRSAAQNALPRLKKHHDGLNRQVTVKNLPQIASWEDLKKNISQHLFYTLSRDRHNASNLDLYTAFALALRDQMARMWVTTQRQTRAQNRRITYYLSMEFYLGRMMKNAIINLGLEDIVNKTMQELDIDLKNILPCETDAGLGNGGLGRLAACFLDSMATLDIPCYGYGLRYEYGIFEQVITDQGAQVERADSWLENGYTWEIPRIEEKVEVKMYGNMENGQWVNTQTVYAIPHDIPIPGYKNGVVGTLRLWKSKATTELSLEMFNTGDYVKAVEQKNHHENITRVLYPDDRTVQGKELRLKQEYFLVAASIRDILNRHLRNESYFETQSNESNEAEANKLRRVPSMFEDQDHVMEYLRKLCNKVAIQLNDTHPSLAIPELMRVLMDEYKLSWDSAWQMVSQCFYYTNHTVLPEALEKWPVEMLNRVLPRHLDIIYQINSIHLAEVRVKMANNDDLVGRMSIVEEGYNKSIRMAYLSIVACQRVNGVARVHSELIRRTLFKDFVDFYPDKNHFTNVTNGVTPRRWIKECNPELAQLITKHIGEDWIVHLPKLAELNKLKEDSQFLAELMAVKKAKKTQFCDLIKTKFHITMNPEWMLSVQVKRIHEYKRQLMNVLHVIILYNQARKGKVLHPRTFVIGGKAAPAYERAKKIITLICKVSKAIDSDILARKYLKLIMLPNYDVSTAQVVIPAADLSEQISLAGMEASGTGNMKFMMNGALTIGTLDGANMEISESVGPDSMFRFGMEIEDVPVARQTYNEDRWKIINENEEIREALELINSGFFMPEDPDRFKDIIYDLREHDYYMLIKDLESYAKAQEKAAEMYYSVSSKQEWYKASLDNIANSGRFSSDEAIKNYAKDIWNVEYTDRSTGLE